MFERQAYARSATYSAIAGKAPTLVTNALNYAHTLNQQEISKHVSGSVKRQTGRNVIGNLGVWAQVNAEPFDIGQSTGACDTKPVGYQNVSIRANTFRKSALVHSHPQPIIPKSNMTISAAEGVSPPLMKPESGRILSIAWGISLCQFEFSFEYLFS